jgi:hypothetical protein
VIGMRVLLAAAVSLVAAAVSAAGATPHTQTLYTRAGGTISGFAQDGEIIAWFTPSARGCNGVHVKQLDNPLKADLPIEGSMHNVTCRWNVGRAPVSIAIAGDQPNLMWTLHENSPLEFDYLVGASVRPTDRRERRFQQLAHTARGAGLWLGGIAGDGSTLVYGVTSVDYVDEAGCLAGTDTCALKIVEQGGGVYRVIDGQKLRLIPGTGAAVAVATSGRRVAYVEADSIQKDGRPVAGADLPINVVDAVTGRVISSITPQGTPIAVALSAHVLATLERTPLGLRLAWYDPQTGLPSGSVPVAIATTPTLSVSDRVAVFHVGRSIRGVDIATGRVRTLASAAAQPIGLSVEGNRVAWAENLKHVARIRAYFAS